MITAGDWDSESEARTRTISPSMEPENIYTGPSTLPFTYNEHPSQHIYLVPSQVLSPAELLVLA